MPLYITSDGFNEWGALLLQEEILNVIEIFERACEECRLTEVDIGQAVDDELMTLITMRNEYKRATKEKKREKERKERDGATSTANFGTSTDNENKDNRAKSAKGVAENNYVDGLINIRSRFHTVTWTCRLLCLDRPGDVNRYQVPSSAFTQVARDMGLGSAEGVVRTILSKKKEFSKENVERCELHLT